MHVYGGTGSRTGARCSILSALGPVGEGQKRKLKNYMTWVDTADDNFITAQGERWIAKLKSVKWPKTQNLSVRLCAVAFIVAFVTSVPMPARKP
jgi:hypothetical protein